MKRFALIIIITFLSLNTFGQKSPFIRVYDLSGKKISKGILLAVTDTSLYLGNKEDPTNIPVKQIGSIRTKHSPGNNIAIASILCVPIMATLGAASSEPDKNLSLYTPTEGAAYGALLGLGIGAGIGGLTILAKNSKTYIINGDTEKWKIFLDSVKGKKINN